MKMQFPVQQANLATNRICSACHARIVDSLKLLE